MNSTAIAIVNESGSLVRRARAGDQVAMAIIRKAGDNARRGSQRALLAYNSIQKYIELHPAAPIKYSGRRGLLAGIFSLFSGEVAPEAVSRPSDPELTKPVLPKGALDQIFDEDLWASVVVRAAKYQHGLGAAAVVLASGPAISIDDIKERGAFTFGQDHDQLRAFFFGASRPDPRALDDADLHDYRLRGCMIAGQVLGRARQIQAVRQPSSVIGRFASVAGWELGE